MPWEQRGGVEMAANSHMVPPVNYKREVSGTGSKSPSGPSPFGNSKITELAKGDIQRKQQTQKQNTFNSTSWSVPLETTSFYCSLLIWSSNTCFLPFKNKLLQMMDVTIASKGTNFSQPLNLPYSTAVFTKCIILKIPGALRKPRKIY